LSLQAQIHSFVTRVAEQFDGVEARIGPVDHLTTVSQGNLVAAINELNARGTLSAGGATYIHVQGSPASEWVIPHNLGRRASVVVLTAGGVEVEATVLHESDLVARIQFTVPFAGTAYLV